jgi:hypothetical protein
MTSQVEWIILYKWREDKQQRTRKKADTQYLLMAAGWSGVEGKRFKVSILKDTYEKHLEEHLKNVPSLSGAVLCCVCGAVENKHCHMISLHFRVGSET